MNLKFTQDHEWIDIDTGTVGITDYAADQLGDVVYVELPEVGAHIDKKGSVAVVESVKAASEIYAPVSGEISEVNEDLSKTPALVNESPLEDGWFFKIEIEDMSELQDLMDEDEYQAFVADLT